MFNDGAYRESHDRFEDEWYNCGAGTTESAYLHGMVQVAAGVYEHVDSEDDDRMRSSFETALRYLQGVSPDFYGGDVLDVWTTLHDASIDPAVLDGDTPGAREADCAFAGPL